MRLGIHDPLSVREARDGDLISYPGPRRRHLVARALELGSSHVGIFAEVNGVASVIEVGPTGVRARPVADILERFDEVILLELPVDDGATRRVAGIARRRLDDRVYYAPALARLIYLWSNFRAVDHWAVRPLARLLYPVVASVGMLFGVYRSTCSGFVQEVLEAAGVDETLGLRLDRPVGSCPHVSRHRGRWARLVSPSDFFASPKVRRFRLDRVVDAVPAELIGKGATCVRT